MELNFNSVEMSRKPNAEASSLGYAEVPLTFNSVETIPNLKASAAFQVDSGKVFKEDTDIAPVIIDKSLSYIPWGGDNEMPYNLLNLIEGDETLAFSKKCKFILSRLMYYRNIVIGIGNRVVAPSFLKSFV